MEPLRLYAEEERRPGLQSEVGSLVLGPKRCVISPVSLRAVLTPRLLRFHSHASALPFIELLSKEAVGLISQDLYAFLREDTHTHRR